MVLCCAKRSFIAYSVQKCSYSAGSLVLHCELVLCIVSISLHDYQQAHLNVLAIISKSRSPSFLSQISSWLKDSAEMFLQNRVDLGTSLETAEDLLMELEEFQTRAKVQECM